MNFDSSCQRILKGSSGMILRTEVLTLRWFKIRMNMVSKNAFREREAIKAPHPRECLHYYPRGGNPVECIHGTIA